MTIYSKYLVYPDGETQEIEHSLRVGMIVDLNGLPMSGPVKSQRVIAYRVLSARQREERGEHSTYYGLELVSPYELMSELGV